MEEFRKQSALKAMECLLNMNEQIWDEYIHRDSSLAHMSIHEYIADGAVMYADALVKRLEK